MHIVTHYPIFTPRTSLPLLILIFTSSTFTCLFPFLPLFYAYILLLPLHFPLLPHPCLTHNLWLLPLCNPLHRNTTPPRIPILPPFCSFTLPCHRPIPSLDLPPLARTIRLASHPLPISCFLPLAPPSPGSTCPNWIFWQPWESNKLSSWPSKKFNRSLFPVSNNFSVRNETRITRLSEISMTLWPNNNASSWHFSSPDLPPLTTPPCPGTFKPPELQRFEWQIHPPSMVLSKTWRTFLAHWPIFSTLNPLLSLTVKARSITHLHSLWVAPLTG